MAALELEHSVEIVGTHRIVMRFPSEKRAVKTLGGGLVGSMKFNPAEGASGMLINVCHGGRSLHQIWAAGYQREVKAKGVSAGIVDGVDQVGRFPSKEAASRALLANACTNSDEKCRRSSCSERFAWCGPRILNSPVNMYARSVLSATARPKHLVSG